MHVLKACFAFVGRTCKAIPQISQILHEYVVRVCALPLFVFSEIDVVRLLRSAHLGSALSKCPYRSMAYFPPMFSKGVIAKRNRETLGSAGCSPAQDYAHEAAHSHPHIVRLVPGNVDNKIVVRGLFLERP